MNEYLTPEEIAQIGPIERLFYDISNRLASIDELAWIDLEAGQLEIPEESYPVQFPCALVDFVDADPEDELENNQQLKLMIQVRLGIDLYEDLHMAENLPAPDRAIAIKRLSIITKLRKCLHGWESDYFTPWKFTGVTPERRDDGIKVFALRFATVAKDDTAANVYDVVQPLGLIINPV
ncbi:hypothetical protein ACTJIJ_22930 [Niabella sp. 22666]|uniref:hypothetical protein n=1 Tax=Niabella sp. 22666 TaxID=3453954 RepID=UPI003F854560